MSELERIIKKMELSILRIEDAKDALKWENIDEVAKRLAMEQSELQVVVDTLKTLEGII